MSYHDQPPDYIRHGIAVVNPLYEQRKRLTKLENFLEELKEEIADPDLKHKIRNILNDTE